MSFFHLFCCYMSGFHLVCMFCFIKNIYPYVKQSTRPLGLRPKMDTVAIAVNSVEHCKVELFWLEH